MQEPVGHASRTPEIPNNSHRSREQNSQQQASTEPREELSKVVTGKVTTRKPGWFKRISRSLIADDATSVADHVVTDVIIPALRNLIYDIITGGASRTLYGTMRGAGAPRRESTIRGGGPVSSIRNRYDRMAEESSRRGGPSPEQRARHDFHDVILDLREDAVGVVEGMMEYASRYGAVSVAEFYNLCGVESNFVDRSWGWTDLSNTDIRQHRGGWLIDLPDPHPLR